MNDFLTQLIESNQWHFIGRLGADPEIRYFESGASVCKAPLLVNKPGQKRDDGQKPYKFKIELWREKAQSFADAARKGDLVSVEGRVKQETWTDQTTGEERHDMVLNVERYQVLAKVGQRQQSTTNTQAPPATSVAMDKYPFEQACPKCGQACAFNPRPDTQHWGSIRCSEHGFLWIPKPSEDRKPKRKINEALRESLPEAFARYLAPR